MSTATQETSHVGVVTFVGSGPGDPGLLTQRAVDALRHADVVVVDTPAQAALAERHAPDAEVVDAGPDPLHAAGAEPGTRTRARVVVRAVDRAVELSRERCATDCVTRPTESALQPGRVVRLVPGDGALLGPFLDEYVAVRDAGITLDVVPGVSAALAVPAYAGMPLGGPDTGRVEVVRAADVAAHAAWGTAWDEDMTLVATGTLAEIGEAVAALAARGVPADTPVAVVAAGTTVAQQVLTGEVGAFPALVSGLHAGSRRAAAARAKAFSGGLVAVVGRGVTGREAYAWFESKPLFGWRVLVPRTKDRSRAMVARLAEYGATTEVVPTIAVEPPRTPQQIERAVKGMVTGRYEWVGFTSVNAVRAVREKFHAFGLDARAFSGLKIAAVGGVTAQALRDWGIEPDLVPDGEQSVRGLLASWPPFDRALDPINRVLLPRADIATDTLVAGLEAMGWEVEDVTAYRTVRAAPPAAPIRDAIKAGAFDAVLFTSSSTVRNLVGIAGKPHATTVIAAIGPATAKSAEEHGLTVSVLASEANARTLVDELADYGAGLREAAVEAGEPVLRPSQRRTAARRRAR